MKKRIAFFIVIACTLLITGCGASNSVEDSTGANSQMAENSEQKDTEEKDIDVLSLLEGVTMEVTEYSDTSVTIRIVNDTDREDILCGSEFCLEMYDEEIGEWRILDEVIDNAGFTMEAYMVQKDSPYEATYDFEWLYGKLEVGRYRIVKNVMGYKYTAEFSI